MKKFLLALAISSSFIGNVEAAELYDVIHREVSYFNASDKESVWITQAILYASSEYQVDPILITAVMEAESGFNFKSTSPVGGFLIQSARAQRIFFLQNGFNLHHIAPFII